jgi:hypothetical protein
LLAAAFVFFTAAPALADQEAMVSRMANRQIVEASGLAVSATIPDLAYTLNDSNNAPVVYAIKISTGQTVGRADLSKFKPKDTESLYVDPRGQMWVGDLGDNDHDRNDVSMIVFPEPGLGAHKITAAQRFGVKYAGGAKANVEAMLVNPTSGQVFLASKNLEGGPGTVYSLSNLQPGIRNLATPMNVRIPGEVTDGTFSPDGSLVLLRTYSSVWIADPTNWNMLRQMRLPRPNKSESIALERGDQSFLLGGEGEDSPLLRVALPLNPVKDKVQKDIDDTGETDSRASAPWGLPGEVPDGAFGVPTKAIAGFGIAIVAALVFGAVLLRRRW